MKSRSKGTMIVFGLALLTVIIGIVFATLTSESKDLSGTYVNKLGQEITFFKDGRFKDIVRFGLASGLKLDRYWRSGDQVRIGTSESRPIPDVTFTVKGDQLEGYDALWTRQVVRSDRPADLIGTYTSSDNESIALDNNGAIYDSQSLPTGSMVRMGMWKVENGNVHAIYGPGEVHDYQIAGNDLMLQGKTLVKQTDETIVPATL